MIPAPQRALLDQALGPVVRALLTEPGVTDILLNPPDPGQAEGPIWVHREGKPKAVAGTMGHDQARALIATVAGTLGRIVDLSRPWVAGELYGDGPRFDGVLPPGSTHPIWAIRVAAPRIYTLDDYLQRRWMTLEQKRLIEDIIDTRFNFLLVGGTGVGKTTLMNAIGHAISERTPEDRVGIIEELGELRFPVKDQIKLKTGEWMDDAAALRRILRYNIRRIIVGEVRGPEALDMLMGWNTGHEGCGCTIHAKTTQPTATFALQRIEDLCRQATEAPMQPTIARSIDYVVTLGMDHDGRRGVTGVHAVHGWNPADGYLTEREA